jgi:hypothetical protein
MVEKWNVSLNKGQDYRVYQFKGKQSTWCGNRPIEPNTKGNYENMSRQVWRFCALKGDYKSMHILVCAKPTRNVPAMRLEMVQEFLWYKHKTKNMLLLKTGSLEHVKDVFEIPITMAKPTIIVESTWIFAPTARQNQHLSSTLAVSTMPACQH